MLVHVDHQEVIHQALESQLLLLIERHDHRRYAVDLGRQRENLPDVVTMWQGYSTRPAAFTQCVKRRYTGEHAGHPRTRPPCHRRLRESPPLESISDLLEDAGQIVWIDVQDPTDEDVELLRTECGFHELALEDVMTRHQRPKIEKYDGYYFLSTRCGASTATRSTCSSASVTSSRSREGEVPESPHRRRWRLNTDRLGNDMAGADLLAVTRWWTASYRSSAVAERWRKSRARWSRPGRPHRQSADHLFESSAELLEPSPTPGTGARGSEHPDPPRRADSGRADAALLSGRVRPRRSGCWIPST